MTGQDPATGAAANLNPVQWTVSAPASALALFAENRTYNDVLQGWLARVGWTDDSELPTAGAAARNGLSSR